MAFSLPPGHEIGYLGTRPIGPDRLMSSGLAPPRGFPVEAPQRHRGTAKGIRMLRILSLLMGPIFAKEMVEMARRKRYYLNRVLYGLVLLFTLLIVYKEKDQALSGKPSIRVM